MTHAVGVPQNQSRQSLQGLPGPRGGRLSGNVGAFESDRLAFLTQASADFGGLVRFDGATTIVNDVELALEILLDRQNAYDVPENLLGRTLRSPALAETRALRPSLNPAMRRQRATSVFPLVHRQLASALSVAGHEPFDPLPILERVISNTVAQHYFGQNHHAVIEPVRDLLDALDKHFGNPWTMPATWLIPLRRRIQTAYEHVEAAVIKQLTLRERRPGDYEDAAADVLARVRQAHPQTPMSRVAQMIVGSLLAAQRVPAAAAAWMLYEVAQSRQHQEVVRGELQTTTQDRAPNAPDIWQQPAALGVVLETLRLHPPTWLLHRRAVRPTDLGAYAVPRGHNFLISPYVLHRDARQFANPEQFIPGRWRGVRTMPASMFPFGKGPHGCPGNDIALTMMLAVLTATIGEHDLSQTGEVRPDPRSTLVPSGLRLRFAASSRAAVSP